jgi:hypothetical protein
MKQQGEKKIKNIFRSKCPKSRDRLSSRSSRLKGGRSRAWLPHASEHAALGRQPLLGFSITRHSNP